MKYVKYNAEGKDHYGRVIGESYDRGYWYKIIFVNYISVGDDEKGLYYELAKRNPALTEITQKEYLMASVLES